MGCKLLKKVLNFFCEYGVEKKNNLKKYKSNNTLFNEMEGTSKKLLNQ